MFVFTYAETSTESSTFTFTYTNTDTERETSHLYVCTDLHPATKTYAYTCICTNEYTSTSTSKSRGWISTDYKRSRLPRLNIIGKNESTSIQNSVDDSMYIYRWIGIHIKIKMYLSLFYLYELYPSIYNPIYI